MSEAEGAQGPMPRYKCHKEVRALKITDVKMKPVGPTGLPGVLGSALHFDGSGFIPIDVSAAWMAKHEPVAGGYYVVYEDGYSSFSPAKAFVDGYTLI